ncbi:MAG TPA: NAD-dependent epimerase/dehydratase family protein [Candidatus Dormibacteraeota bacterium]|nr:NAD-dependent epimerase/dehydratase family protein [Candidatus Dormibacteraeota bacterium]
MKKRSRKPAPSPLTRTLVTGADGFIGGLLVSRLEALGSDVYRLSRKGTGPKTITNDIGKDPIVGLADIKPQAVFHLAGRVHRMDEGGDAEAEHIRVTVDGTTYLLQAAADAGVQAFVFFSTVAVLPEGLASELDENTRPAPTTPYGRAKLRAEELVLAMNGKSGMRTVCLRLPMVYGPGHKGHLPRMIAAIDRGVFPPLPQYPGKRSLVHVEDAIDAAILVATRPEAAGKVYIVSEPRPYSSREIYEIVLQALGRQAPGWHVPRAVLASGALLGDLGERVARRRLPFDSAALSKLSVPAMYSGRRIERELGFRTKKTFATAAREVVAQRKAS